MTDASTAEVTNVSTGLNWPAIIASLVTLGSMASIVAGQPALGAVIADPHTAAAATAIVGGVGALISAFSKPVHALVAHVTTVVAK